MTVQPTQQAPADAVARVDADCPPSELWATIANSDEFQQALVDAVRELLADVHYTDRVQTLVDAGVTAADGLYAAVLASLDRPAEEISAREFADQHTDATPVEYQSIARHAEALDVTAGFGQETPTIIGHLDLDDVTDGPLAALDGAGREPTITVHIDATFRERRRSQQERTCRLLATVGEVCDVQVVTSRLTAAVLAREFGDVLPPAFTEAANATLREGDTVDEHVATAHEELDTDGRAVQIIRDLAGESGGTLRYAQLTAMHEVSDGRISQLLGTLEDLHLAERFGKQSQRAVELLPAGEAYLDALDEEIGRQQSLEDCFSERRQRSDDSRVDPRTGSPPTTGGGSRNRLPRLHTMEFLDRPQQAAVAAAAPDGAIATVDHPVEELDDRAHPLWGFDEETNTLIVGTEVDGPLPMMTSIAMGLAHRRTFDEVLSPAVLDGEDGELGGLDVDDLSLLRDARCLGYLSDEDADAESYRDRLLEARDRLGEMTRKLCHGEYEDRDRFRGAILQEAHGLAGTMVHLLDLAGVNVVRFGRVPRFSRDFKDSDQEDLAECVAKHVAITSRYGQFSAYRNLFEDREEKRQSALSPTVDADDPLGELIGSVVLVGPGISRLETELVSDNRSRSRLRSPGPVHDDAPEFAVHVPVVTEPGREAYAETVARMCRAKNIRPTREGVSIIQAFAGSVYDAARALNWLSPENDRRELRLDEARYALSHLEGDRILTDAKPTVSKIVSALLGAHDQLTQSELAERADVSARSIQRHRDRLEALDLIDIDEDGYRLNLPFTTDAERGASILPDPVTDDHSDAREPLFDLVLAEIGTDQAGRLGDPDDPLGVAFYWPPDYDGIVDEIPDLDPWIDIARALCGTAQPTQATAQLGADVEQASLQDAASVGGGAG